jgi:hypothetical protein
VDLTYIGTSTGDAGDKYMGLDRFGRVVDQRWKDSSSDLDRYQYGYLHCDPFYPSGGRRGGGKVPVSEYQW